MEELLSEWYAALYDEDCIRLMKLLGKHPQLLKEEIPNDPQRLMEGRIRKKGPRKRRTALHVGARRGCLKLVKLVMDEVRTNVNDGKIWSESMLDELLMGKDGEFELDALAMAVVNGNQEIIRLLARCSRLISKTNPYDILRERSFEGILIDSMIPIRNTESGIVIPRELQELRKITQDVMESHPEYYRKVIEEIHKENLEYNFLPLDEYVFHLTSFRGPSYEVFEDELEQVRRGIFEKTNSCSPSLQAVLCKLQDGQGRTALHVAVDQGTVKAFLALIPNSHEAASASENFFLDSLDGTGRKALHRAAALNSSKSLGDLLGDDRVNVDANFSCWEYAESLKGDFGVDLDLLSKKNGFEGSAFGSSSRDDTTSALGFAILHRKPENVKLLLHKHRTGRVDFSRTFLKLQGDKPIRLTLGPLQLAALVGDASILEVLLKDETTCDPGRPSPLFKAQCSDANPRPAIHLAAAAGRFDMLTLMMGKRNYDPFVIDTDGNTTLHHAVNGREFEFDIHLIDHINCKHVCDSRQLIKNRYESMGGEQKKLVMRQGCIELLLQFGFDAWNINKGEELPYLGSDSSTAFLSWWFNRWTKETIASQRTLNEAANAIVVTAILVATASYMGPFQPPLGYDDEDRHMQIRDFVAEVYLFCETMAFYLAIAAVILGLMTFLHLPQESMLDELKRTRQRVIIAVGFLFPAIIFLLLDFATASIIVVPQEHAAVPKSTVCLGLFICVFVIFLFMMRLVTVSHLHQKVVSIGCLSGCTRDK